MPDPHCAICLIALLAGVLAEDYGSREFFFCDSAGHVHVLGLEGWRFAFFTIACVSLLVGVFTLLFARDPYCAQKWQLWQADMASLSMREIFQEIKGMCAVPTFLIIIFQVRWSQIMYVPAAPSL